MKNNKKNISPSEKSRKDFYMKFNVKDFMTDSNLRECGPESIGVYIFILCVLFNSKERGKYLIKSEAIKNFAEFLPRQNVQQTNQQDEQQIKSICRIFAERLVKHLPFTENEISAGLTELISNDILYFEGCYLCQKRMIRDASISKSRSDAGKKGASVTNKLKKAEEILPQQNAQQNGQQNPNYNYNNNNIDNKGSNNGSVLKENNSIVNNNNVVADENLKNININNSANEKKIAEVAQPAETVENAGYSGDVYRLAKGNESLSHPVEVCLWNYLNNPIYEKTRELHAIRLNLDKDPDVALKKIEPWAAAFNRSLLNDGKVEMPMVSNSGNSAWVAYFPNWVNRTNGSRKGIDPDVLFTKNDKIVKYNSATTGIDEQIASEENPQKRRDLQKQKYNGEILNKSRVVK